MEETISLKEIFETIRKRISLIIILTFTTAAIAAIFSYFVMTPVYQVSTQILVNRNQVGQNFNTNEVQTNIQLIDTYTGIITSSRILEPVIEELNLDLTVDQVKNKISVQSNRNQIMNINVQDPDPEQAVRIANKVAEVFQKEIPNLMNVDNVNILAEAKLSENMGPVKPRPVLNIAIALVIGLMAGVGLAFLFEYLDTSLKTESDVEKYLEIPVLGVITTINGNDSGLPTKGKGRTLRGGK